MAWKDVLAVGGSLALGVGAMFATGGVAGVALGTGIIFSTMQEYFDAKASDAQSEAAIETEKQREKIAEENVELSDLESLSASSKAENEHIYLSSQMKLNMSKAGLSPMTQEIWMGQTLAEMDYERQTTLGSGQKQAKRYSDEADWLRGNIGNLQESQKWGELGHIFKAGAKAVGLISNPYQWRQQQQGLSRGVSKV